VFPGVQARRRPSPASVLAVFVLACLAPLGVAAATTGLADAPGADRTEVAGGGHGDDSGGVDPARIEGDGAAPGSTVAGGQGGGPAPSQGSGGTSTTAAPATSTVTPTAPSTSPPSPPGTPVPTAPPPTAPATTRPTPAPAPSLGEQVVALANAARAEAGCDPLRIDARLTAAAQAHSDDMAAQDYFAHTSLDGRSAWDRMLAAGYPRPAGENIAQGQRSASEVHDAWMGSPRHRDNILECSFTAVGVGVDTGSWTWTQDFGF
jgi:uncharacterized protein YkwD